MKWQKALGTPELSRNRRARLPTARLDRHRSITFDICYYAFCRRVCKKDAALGKELLKPGIEVIAKLCDAAAQVKKASATLESRTP